MNPTKIRYGLYTTMFAVIILIVLMQNLTSWIEYAETEWTYVLSGILIVFALIMTIVVASGTGITDES